MPAGECREHPCGQSSQRPPQDEQRLWSYVAGRGAGKTRAAACQMQQRVDASLMKLGCLIAPTVGDLCEVTVEGSSGLLVVAPSWYQPGFKPSNTRLGRQEIYAEFLETSEGVWFTSFDSVRHLAVQAEYDLIYHGRCAIEYPADSHSEEDLIDTPPVADVTFPEDLVPRPNIQPVHAARILGTSPHTRLASRTFRQVRQNVVPPGAMPVSFVMVWD